MKQFGIKTKFLSVSATGCLILLIVLCILVVNVYIAQAAWREPGAAAPDDNAYAPLDIGPESQAKQGRLLLDPMYNPSGSLPDIQYPLEVKGSRDVYINNFEIAPTGNLTVDTDTLYVSGSDHAVGFGTVSPAERVDVVGGGVSVGSSSVPVSGNALVIINTSEYGAYGLSQAADTASVRGESTAGSGIYGLNTAAGIGIRAESTSASAVSGSTSADMNNPNITAGVFGRARGLGAWAGYFEQRVYGSQEAVAQTFLASRLQYSAIPYSAGWKMQDVDQSYKPQLGSIAYDGKYLWVNDRGVYWSQAPYFYKIDPTTGELVDEMRILGSASSETDPTHGEMLYADGYIWSANGYQNSEGIYRIDPNNPSPATIYSIGNHSGAYDGPDDFIYDTTTNLTSDYIWAFGDYLGGYYITRLQPGIDEYGFCDNPAYNDQASCVTNGGNWLDQFTEADFAGQTCPVCLNCTGNTITEPCSVPGYYYAAECTANGGTWSPDANFGYRELGSPSGITFDGSKAWVAFRGTADTASGLISFDTADPANTTTVHCAGPNVSLRDIDYGANWLWSGDKRRGDTNPTKAFSIDPAADPLYSGIVSYSGLMTGLDSIFQVEFDNSSPGEPYLWLANTNGLTKAAIDPNTKALTLVNKYSLPYDMSDFAFVRDDPTNPIVWTTHGTTGVISKRLVNTPYASINYLPKGGASAGTAFDGTYLWTANYSTNLISKYSSSDGRKIGDYEAGWFPIDVVFDGTYLWTLNDDHFGDNPDGNNLNKIDVTTGAKVDGYDFTTINYLEGDRFDMDFDGQYIWLTLAASDDIIIIDPQKIGSGPCSPGACTGVQYFSFADHGIDGPYRLQFDGVSMWITEKTNQIQQLSYDGSTLTVGAPIVLSDIGSSNFNIQATAFDGTYLWLGTNRMDEAGHSVYKVDATNTGNPVIGKYTVFNHPGTCTGGGRANLYCHSDSDCPDSVCDSPYSIIKDIIFDGSYLWIQHGGRNDGRGSIECDDGIDNDGDGATDAGTGNDSQCEDLFDLREGARCNDGQDNDSDGLIDMADTDCSDPADDTEGNPECNDRIDNNGDGLCDYDGAVGSPGCSGKPDPGCSSATDISESYAYYDQAFVSRLNVATDEVVENIYYDRYTQNLSGILYDGMNIWLNDQSNLSGYSLHKFYAGTGLKTDLTTIALLQGNYPNIAQAGSFNLDGSMNIGAMLEVQGDIVAPANTWGGGSDNLKSFGTACDQGQFAKGVDLNTGQIQCRPL